MGNCDFVGLDNVHCMQQTNKVCDSNENQVKANVSVSLLKRPNKRKETNKENKSKFTYFYAMPH